MTYVIIVHHRGRLLLERCLKSLLLSLDEPLQVVVVGNGCDEELPDVVADDDRVHVVHSQLPIGFSEANNLGVSWAVSELGSPDRYLFLNNDTLVEPESLARMARCFEDDDEVGVVGPRLMIFGGENHLNSLGLNVTRTGEAWDEGIGQQLAAYGALPAPEVLAVTGAALFVRADLLEKLGGWAEYYRFYFEDIDLCLRARSLGWKVVCVHDAVIWHAISATAARGSDFKRMLSWRNRFLLVLAHWPWRLLLRVGPAMAWSELRLLERRLRHKALADAKLQLRSWLEACKGATRALAARRSNGSRIDWVPELKPHGSVPVIQLPPLEGDPLA